MLASFSSSHLTMKLESMSNDSLELKVASQGVPEVEINNVEQTAYIQQNLEHSYTRWQAMQAYPKTCVYIGIVVFVMISCGFEGAAGGNVLAIPAFRKDFGHLYSGSYSLEASWQSAISGVPLAASVFGGFFGSYVSDIFGRKWTITLTVASTLAFVAIEFAATTIEVFFAGKTLNAFAIGILTTVCTAYTAEIAPLALRGLSISACNFALCIGPFCCALIMNTTGSREDRWAYRFILLSQWIFSGVSLVMLIILPESAYFHVIRNKEDKALVQLRKIYQDEAMAQQQLCIIKQTVEEEKAIADSTSFLECFKGNNFRRTLVSSAGFMMQPQSGVVYVSSYGTYYYQLLNFTDKQSFQLGCGKEALSVVGSIASWFIVDRFGRRFVMLYGMISLAVLNVLTAGLGTQVGLKSFVNASVAFLTMYNFFYNSSLGPVSYVIGAENANSQLRTKTLSIGIAVNQSVSCMWAFVLPYLFNTNQAHWGSKINFLFAGFCFIAIPFFYFWLPETAGRSYQEIDEMYNKKVPARKFKTYITDNRTEAESVFNGEKSEAGHIENV